MIKVQLTGIAQSIKQEVLYSVGEECTSLSSGTSLDELSFSQFEADTIPLPGSPTSLVLSYVLANTPMESNGQGWGAWSSLVEMC